MGTWIGSERKRSSLNKSSKKSRQRSGDRAAPDIQEQRELTRMMTQRTSKSRRWPKGTKRFTETMPSIQVDSAVQGNIPKGGHKTKQKATVRLRREGGMNLDWLGWLQLLRASRCW